jgi:hypothetical protein
MMIVASLGLTDLHPGLVRKDGRAIEQQHSLLGIGYRHGSCRQLKHLRGA